MNEKDWKRFEAKFAKRENGCWEWLATIGGTGRGYFRLGRGMRIASRVSWEHFYGPIPHGLGVCHSCDNPICVNPAHLWLGTQKDNMADCKTKGRLANLRGERHPNAKLKDADIKSIKERRQAGEKLQSIAESYGVNHRTISGICVGSSWAAAQGAAQ